MYVCVHVYVRLCVCVSADVEYMPVPRVRGWEFLSYLRLLCSCPELIAVPITDRESVCWCVWVCVSELNIFCCSR